MRRTTALVLFAAGFLASTASDALLRPGEPAWADVSKLTDREAFKAGSERSEGTLKEIAETLKKIDARLERIEQVATKR